MKTTAKDLLPVLKEEAPKFQQQITALEVTDEASLKVASDRVKQVKDWYKALEAEKKAYTAPANAILAKARADFDPILKALKGFEDELKQKSATYLVAKTKKADEEKAKIAARVEKGTMRVDTALRKQDQVDDAKDVRTAESGMRMQMRKDVEFTAIGHMPGEALKQLAELGYISWNESVVRKAVLAGEIVPGTKIIEKPIMQSV